MSPQWEGELELDPASDGDTEYEEDGGLVARNHAAENGLKDYTSVIRESSLWILVPDLLCPTDVLLLRTAGSKWNNAKLYGEFAELWFYLLTTDGSEGREPVTLPKLPSLCFGCRQNFGFAPSVAILAQAISCSNVHGVLPVHERVWFCLVQVSTNQFCSFSFLMARVSDGTNLPISLAPASFEYGFSKRFSS